VGKSRIYNCVTTLSMPNAVESAQAINNPCNQATDTRGGLRSFLAIFFVSFAVGVIPFFTIRGAKRLQRLYDIHQPTIDVTTASGNVATKMSKTAPPKKTGIPTLKNKTANIRDPRNTYVWRDNKLSLEVIPFATVRDDPARVSPEISSVRV